MTLENIYKVKEMVNHTLVSETPTAVFIKLILYNVGFATKVAMFPFYSETLNNEYIGRIYQKSS